VNRFYIFVLRIILGAVFAVILTRFFFQDVNTVYVIGLGIFLIFMAYIVEYMRSGKSKP